MISYDEYSRGCQGLLQGSRHEVGRCLENAQVNAWIKKQETSQGEAKTKGKTAILNSLKNYTYLQARQGVIKEEKRWSYKKIAEGERIEIS